MSITSIIGICAGTLTSFSLVPQFVKNLKEKKADGVSFWMLGVLLAGLCGWILYGFFKNDWPIILTNCFAFIMNCGILVLRFKYGNK